MPINPSMDSSHEVVITTGVEDEVLAYSVFIHFPYIFFCL